MVKGWKRGTDGAAVAEVGGEVEVFAWCCDIDGDAAGQGGGVCNGVVEIGQANGRKGGGGVVIGAAK